VLARPLSGLIYLLAFSRFGVGTPTDTERRPDHRQLRKQASLVAVTAAFSIATSLVLYGWEHQNGRRTDAFARSG
jgi:hypothetical protein